jgi:hypothetical protein
MSSIEEQIEDIDKKQLNSYSLKYYAKTENINPEIDNAMREAPSKSGGDGTNYPDIRLLLETANKKQLPIMVEVKGIKDRLVKLNDDGSVANFKKNGEPNYANIKNYAVNGAVHYAKAIIDFTDTYKEVIAIGSNGYMKGGEAYHEPLQVYYVSKDNLNLPKKIGEYADLSFLSKENFDAFIEKVRRAKLTDAEVEQERANIENKIEVSLKNLNQQMRDKLNIPVNSRVELISGMIIAGLGVKGKVAPLEIADLRGETGEQNNDGQVIIRKIKDFLTERNLPSEKRDLIINTFSKTFIFDGLWQPVNGESKLKTVYSFVNKNILPIFTSNLHLDFTGKLFNVLNAWVQVPDGGENDKVLTPRYVTEMMAKLCKVDKDSYVWDYATGTAGFLVSSMRLMIDDAKKTITSQNELKEKINHIKLEQLLGVKK